MLPAITLVDTNPRMVSAWQSTFDEFPEIKVVYGSLLDQKVDAWVSPTNSRGSMDGGLDAQIKHVLGAGVQAKVWREIGRLHGGKLPVGHAVRVLTGRGLPSHLISTPTMSGAADDVSATMNVALACGAALHASEQLFALGLIRSVAMPGFGANTGRVPPEVCASLMWMVYRLCSHRRFESFAEMRQTLEGELGDLTRAPLSRPRPPKRSLLAWLLG
jgi:O-acetyl-ADP-ribose deacetylase (regulator of RNase III)